jgi:hypothetical protein
MEYLAALVAMLCLLALYLLPTLVADSRHHKNVWAIGALNLLLGWTFLGWILALVWALTAQDK